MVPGSIPEGSYLNLGGSRERMPGSYPDRRVQSGALNDVIAADLLLRLGERPVGDQQLAVTDMDDLGLTGRAERPAVQPDPTLVICSTHDLTAIIIAASSSPVTPADSSTQNISMYFMVFPDAANPTVILPP